MYNSKLTQIIASLSDREIKEFEKFLIYQSDISSKVYVLFSLFMKAYPDLNHPSLSKDKVFIKLFGKIPYKDVKVREQMSALRKYVEAYLIQQELHKVEYDNQLALLKQYRKRGLDGLFQQQTKSVQQLVGDDEFLNIESSKRAYKLANEQNNFFEQQQKITFDDAISLKSAFFDKYYFGAKLRILCEILNREKILNAQYAKPVEKEIIEIVERHKNLFLDVPAIHCYFEIYQLLQTADNPNQLAKALNTLNRYQKSFTDSELKSMYAYLSNYCIQEVNKGNATFTPILFDMQKLLLQNKILLVNGILSHISYRNIVAIAIKLNEYSWAEKFIQEYKGNITARHQDNAYNLSKSNLLYAQGDYQETVYLLNQVEFTDVYYASTAKYTLLKAYYALKEFETLDYFVASFQLYLRRNKDISDNFKKSSESFLRLFKKLLLLVKQVDYREKEKLKKKKKQLREAIDNEKILANKSWLLQELNKVEL